MIALRRSIAWCVAAVFGMGCVAVVLAQGRTEATNTDGSIAALTSEVRQLRIAVEQSTRSQTQIQALGVYLSVQQSRILQVGTRLDLARKELETATAQSAKIASQLAGIEAGLFRITEPQLRAAIEDRSLELKEEQKVVAFQEQQARGRESELSQALRLEDSRWADLISRLEQEIKR